MTAALEIDSLEVFYGPARVLHHVGLTIAPGEAVAVIGSNGAGKTSILRGIMGLAATQSRKLDFFGGSLQGLASFKVARLGVGYVPEGRELFPNLTVLEELQIGGRMLKPAERETKLEEVFTLFPRLKERTRQVAKTMSGGEQQMLAIARIVMRSPSLLLLDEPSLGLAPVIQDVVFETLQRLNDGGLPILLVEQNAFRALHLCSRAYVLELGQVVAEGSSKALLNDPAIQTAYLGKEG